MDFGITLVVALAIASQFHPACALQMQKGNGEYLLTYHILTYSTSMTPLDFYRNPGSKVPIHRYTKTIIFLNTVSKDKVRIHAQLSHASKGA